MMGPGSATSSDSGSASTTTDSATGSGSGSKAWGSGWVTTGVASMKARTGVGAATSSGARCRAAGTCSSSSTGTSTAASTEASTGSWFRGSACLATRLSTVGTAARMVSSRERATGGGGAAGTAEAGVRVGSGGWGVGTGRGTARGVGGVRGTRGTSTSASGSGGSTRRALSRCSRLRRSAGLGTCFASACSAFLRIERMTIGSQPGGGSRSSSFTGPPLCGVLGEGRRMPKVDGAAIRVPIMGSRSTAEEAVAAVGIRREPRGGGEDSAAMSSTPPASPWPEVCCS